ncbi:hypothetical protein HAX54_044715 [Datura stramonium]|uniref:1-phosphatidylinositol 4-kinase n=1 Tax=Datura stramonium TaxID=4076 RepID=A0ABS8WGX2_DATST|nr:hypothetical protein [Datura stramonium]
MAVAINPQNHGFKPFDLQGVRFRHSLSSDYNSILESSLTHSHIPCLHEFSNIQSFPPRAYRFSRTEEDLDSNARVEIIGGHRAPKVHALVVEVAIAMASGINPDYCPNSLSANRAWRSIKIGETGVRESAYLLDHDGFAGVPPTTLVKFFTDLGASGFSVASIHRVRILDIRLLNLDRHAGNLLNHLMIHTLNGCIGLKPPSISESEMEYICGLDPFKDADLLRSELPSIRESSIRVLVVCTIFQSKLLL